MKEIKRSNSKIKPGKYYATFAYGKICGNQVHSLTFEVTEAVKFDYIKRRVAKFVEENELAKAEKENDTVLMLASKLDPELFYEALDFVCWEFKTDAEADNFYELIKGRNKKDTVNVGK